jgi:hypothetical protein
MDVKNTLLNGIIQEEVYVSKSPGFENSKYPNRVYKLSKALYGLKQAHQTWYARLKNFLLDHGYVMGSMDKTLFTLKHSKIYVDDIIFYASSHVLVQVFRK